MISPYLGSDRPKADLVIPVGAPGERLITLENGLTIIVREDHSAPVVSAQAWCMAGSIHEDRWLGAGLSHVLEHMLFKGTTTRGPARIDQEVQEAGGYMNAYTSFDRTVYWINVPNTGARIAIDILCDVAQHATLPEEELVKEKQVILREMDLNQDDPGRRSSRRLFEIAYTRSPYRLTVIGYPSIFKQLRHEDIINYYREKYAPNNLFFVVVGDVQAEAVEEQIRQAFSQAIPHALASPVVAEEPPQIASREVIEEAPIQLGHVHLSWHIPNVRHPDVPLLDVLATLLGSGRSSRLYQQVREKAGLAQAVEAWTYNPGNSGLFGISAVLEADKFAAAGAAILAETERMKAQPVSPEELTKAVKQFTAGTLAARKTMQGQAQDLGGNWLVAHDLNFSERYLSAVKRVSSVELQRVAREYLTTENRTVFALLPKGNRPRPVEVAARTVDHAVRKLELPNGLRLLIKEDHRLPFIQFRSVFKGGVLAETKENSGVTLLLAKMLLKGTRRRSAEQIATEIESIGGNLDTYAGNNSFGVNAEVLSEDFDTGLDLMADTMLNPAFPSAALDFEREMQLASLKAQKDQVLQMGGRALRRSLFGDAGYGLDVHGDESSVARIQAQDLRSLHQRLAVANNSVLAIFGDIEPARVYQSVERILGSWSAGAVVPLPGEPRALQTVERVTEFLDKKQAVVLVGFRGISLSHPDRFALELLQEACSDLGSRLFLRIREKLGLAYYVGAQNFLGLAPGYFAFYAGTAPDQVQIVEQEILAEAALLRESGLTPEELKRSQAKLIGQKKISRQDLGVYAMTTALDELYGLGYTNIDLEDALYAAVTPAATIAVARKYLTPDAVVIATVRPPA